LKSLTWRMVVVCVLTIAAVVYIVPTFVKGAWPRKQINLGLDLQGGMHLVLEVDTDKAVAGTIERTAHEMRDELKKARIRFQELEPVGKGFQISVKLDEEGASAFDQILDKSFPDLRVVTRTSDAGAVLIILDLPEKETAHIKTLAHDQALETIRNRVDEFGVSEPDIRNQGDNRILIQLPGIRDTQRAKDLIGRTAQLEFKLLDEANNPADYVEKTPPPGSELLWQVQMDRDTNREVKTPFLLLKRAVLTGAYLTDARVQIDSQYNEPYVSINFDRKGARIFEKITEENVKKRLAIVLRAGALPAPVTVLEERTVGPSLGADSINKGLLSMIVGGILVVVFMVVYYGTGGLIADLALILNIVFIAAGLAGLQATLTLPGIAGIILTIGMAVDANVLVFERIREEKAIGKTLHAAVNAGYERATLTILDANITTLIAALVLFQFGTGPVKGFAVTLSLGVVSSVFTALFVSRIVIDFLLQNRKVKHIAI